MTQAPKRQLPETGRDASDTASWNGDWYQGWQGPQRYAGSWSWGYGSDWQWGTWKKYDWTASEKQPVDLYPEVVPEFIQAWLLLSDANIEIPERNLIMTAIQGDLSLQRVAQELRTHFPDSGGSEAGCSSTATRLLGNGQR